MTNNASLQQFTEEINHAQTKLDRVQFIASGISEEIKRAQDFLYKNNPKDVENILSHSLGQTTDLIDAIKLALVTNKKLITVKQEK